ncbi:MAG: hypothetical protein KA775_03055 [Ottowia sp.]|nr:hypothetical protein [Ottowia sp.]
MKPIPTEIRRSANRLAHLMAEEYEAKQRRAITLHLGKLAASGASYRELEDELKRMRRQVLLPNWQAPSGSEPA